ncbi:MAG: hypothetical protein Q8823_02425, partial [Candidatus Phytoplasma australasiaticum]|nr:hypothetical protein [Candidatus Phytoplasma australasiaticum]
MKIFSLKKVIISALLLTISFFIEFVFTKFFFQDCHGALIKLEIFTKNLKCFLFCFYILFFGDLCFVWLDLGFVLCFISGLCRWKGV